MHSTQQECRFSSFGTAGVPRLTLSWQVSTQARHSMRSDDSCRARLRWLVDTAAWKPASGEVEWLAAQLPQEDAAACLAFRFEDDRKRAVVSRSGCIFSFCGGALSSTACACASRAKASDTAAFLHAPGSSCASVGGSAGHVLALSCALSPGWTSGRPPRAPAPAIQMPTLQRTPGG